MTNVDRGTWIVGRPFPRSTVHDPAWSDACRNQAFRVGSSVYGLQFHLEVTPAMVADWCQEDENAADMRELKEPIDPDLNASRLAELSASVFGRWAKLLVNS